MSVTTVSNTDPSETESQASTSILPATASEVTMSAAGMQRAADGDPQALGSVSSSEGLQHTIISLQETLKQQASAMDGTDVKTYTSAALLALQNEAAKGTAYSSVSGLSTEDSSSTSAAGTQAPGSGGLRHFKCNIHVQSIRNLVVGPTMLRVYTRYLYSFFGRPSPVFTKAVEVGRHSERRFENSSQAFNFVATWNETQAAFETLPLEVELYSSSSFEKNQLVGVARLSLQPLLGKMGAARIDQYVAVNATEATTRRIAELRMFVDLQEVGEAPADEFALTNNKVGCHFFFSGLSNNLQGGQKLLVSKICTTLACL